MNDILVSICCITYNHEDYIEKAIEGFLMQRTNFAFEILIHDDASTDGTADIIRKYQRKYPDVIKPILQKENQYSKGVRINITYNHPRAKGKYIALCEGDDYWCSPIKLQKQVDFMEKHTDCTLCFHAAMVIDVSSNTKCGIIRPYYKTMVLSDKKLFFGGGSFVPTASILYSKDALEDPPKFFYTCPVGDHVLALLLSTKGRVFYIDEVMSVRNLWVPNSWNTKYHHEYSDREKIIHLTRMIETIEEFNDYSYGKWNKDIARLLYAWRSQILFLKGIVNPLEDAGCKKLIRRMRGYEKVKNYSKLIMPNTYRRIAALKNMFIKSAFKQS